MQQHLSIYELPHVFLLEIAMVAERVDIDELLRERVLGQSQE